MSKTKDRQDRQDRQERKERQTSRPYQAPRVLDERQLVQDALASL